ncbi:MAG: UvrD-helicase domain-containing protein [Sphingobacteriia bacterium]|nr:UvrD-helicase domain-containing protein [Sphingobacteriia bacterium]
MSEILYFALNPSYSCWISASAGSGKTKLLTDRFISLLLNSVNPKKILCITYTKAAANEMKQRIISELKYLSTCEEEILKEKIVYYKGNADIDSLIHAKKLYFEFLQLQDQIKIQTIHSFCFYLLKQFPLEANLDPNFKLIDDIEKDELMKKTRNQILLDKEIKNSLQNLLAKFSIEQFDELIEELLFHQNEIENLIYYYGDFEKTLIKLKEILGIFSTKELLIKDFIDKTYIIKDEILSHIGNVISFSKSTKTDIEKASQIQTSLSEIKDNNFNSYVQIFLTKENSKLKRFLSNSISSTYPQSVEYLLNEQDRVFLFKQNLLNYECFELSSLILGLCDKIKNKYEKIKGRNKIDFNEVLYKTKELLLNKEHSDWVLYKLDGGLDHFLIDEAQDTNPIQWQIIDALTAEIHSGANDLDNPKTIFIVGDEKQSIYSFHGADPTFFNYKKLILEKQMHIAMQNFKIIPLNKSYRSAPPILEVTDKIFSLDVAKIISNEKISHSTVKEFYIGKVNIWPIVHKDLQAEYVANEIEKWFIDKKKLPNKNRFIEPSDIMILVRRRGEFLSSLVNELNLRNLPNTGLDQVNPNKNIIFLDILSIFKFINLPLDELNLAALLKSPLFNLSESDLLSFLFEREKNLFNNISSNSISEKLSKLLHLKNMKIDEIFEQAQILLDIHSIYSKIYGNEAIFIIEEFEEIIYEFINENKLPTLSEFILLLENNDLLIKKELDNNQNKIKITTVHGSKGLQAPIVILADAQEIPINRSKLLWKNDETPMLFLKIGAKSEIINNILEEEQIFQYAEYLRLLYVAITRAEDEFCIISASNKDSINEKSWYSLTKLAIEQFSNHILINNRLIYTNEDLSEINELKVSLN